MIHDADYFPEKGQFGRVLTSTTPNNPGSYDFSDEFKYYKMYFPPTPWCSPSGPPTLVATQKDEIHLADEIPYEFIRGF